MTHTSFLTVLLRSFPNSLAEMKCSLKAGISVSVAKQPTADIKQLINRVRTGIGGTLSCILTSHCLSVSPNHARSLSANLTLTPTNDRWTSHGSVYGAKTWHTFILTRVNPQHFHNQRRAHPQVKTESHDASHYTLFMTWTADCTAVVNTRLSYSQEPFNYWIKVALPVTPPT